MSYNHPGFQLFSAFPAYRPKSSGKYHTGADYAAAAGTDVPAEYGGKVFRSGPINGYGMTVIVESQAADGSKFYTLYGHLGPNPLAKGADVAPGKIIGKVGETDYVNGRFEGVKRANISGPHLHLEIISGAVTLLREGPLGIDYTLRFRADPETFDPNNPKFPFLQSGQPPAPGQAPSPSSLPKGPLLPQTTLPGSNPPAQAPLSPNLTPPAPRVPQPRIGAPLPITPPDAFRNPLPGGGGGLITNNPNPLGGLYNSPPQETGPLSVPGMPGDAGNESPQPQAINLPSPSGWTPSPSVVMPSGYPFALPPDDAQDQPYYNPSSVGIGPQAALQLPSSESISRQLTSSNASGTDLAPSSTGRINTAGVNAALGAMYPFQYFFANALAAANGYDFSWLFTPVPPPDSIFDVQVTGYGEPPKPVDNTPVLLDLSGNGINITQLSSSNTYFDMVGDGYQHRTAWAGTGNGVLVYDTNGDGKITQANQIAFTLWDPTAKSDMQALLDVFDTNHDGKLDAGDTNFAKFKVLVSNADGTQTLKSLTDLGVTSINLVENTASIELPDGSSIDGMTTFTRTDGSTGQAATVTLASDAQGYKVNQLITHNADGSTTIDNKTLNTDGSLANETITLTSADGKTRTLSFDDNGDGVIDRIQTDVISTAANGTISEILSNYTGASLASSYLVDRTVTTTTSNAGGRTVSIDRDTDGDGLFDQNETQVTSATGDLTITITDYNPDGSIADRSTKTLTNNGLSRTDTFDLDGNGIIDLTKTDITTVSSTDQSRTETVSDVNANGTLRDKTITVTSATGASKTVSHDYDGDGVIDQITSLIITPASIGGSVTAQRDANADGSLIGATQTTISSDGLSTITLVDSFGATDASHNPVYDSEHSDVTVVNADQSRTQTVSDYVYANGAPTKLVSLTQIVKGADGISRTTKIDGNGALDTQGNPVWSSIETVAIDSAHNNNVVDTLKVFNPDGTLSSETVTTTSADGLTITTQIDQGGNVDASNNPVFDSVRTVVTAKNADKSSTIVTTNLGGDGHAVIDTTTITTSADGLTVKTVSNVGGDTTTATDITTINPDGSRKEVVQVTAPGSGTNPTPVLLSTIETDTSSDQRTVLTKEDIDGDGSVDRLTSNIKGVGGAQVEDVSEFAPNGSLISKTETWTSANGLEQTKTSNIDGKVDGITTDITVLNIDGSSTNTVTQRSNNGGLISQTATTTSGNGFSSTVTSSIDGKTDSTVTDVKSIAANGDRIEVVTTYDPTKAKVAATQTTSSANGLLKTTLIDENGDGTFDVQTTDQKTLNATDGSVTELVTTATVAASPVILGRSQTFTSANGLTVTMSVDHTGDGIFDEVTNIIKDAAGNATTTVDHYDPNSKKINETVTTSHANGLFKQTQTDVNGDGVFDRTVTDSTILNQDGSQTETVTSLAGTTTAGTMVTTTNGNGTLVTAQRYIDGTAATGSLVETDQSQIVYNPDGSITKTSTSKSQNGSIFAQTTMQISADQKVTTATTNLPQVIFGAFQTAAPASIVETRAVQADGSLKDTINFYKIVGFGTSSFTSLQASRTIQTSANGLSKTESWDLNGDGSADETQSDVTTIGVDGGTTEIFADSEAFSSAGFSENINVTTVTSANGLQSSSTSSIDLGEDKSAVVENRTGSINPDGSKTVVTTANVTVNHGSTNVYAGSDASVVSTSRDGLTKTTQLSTWGNNTFYRTDSLTTHLDGSTTETVTNLNDDNSVRETKTVNVSADQRTMTVADQTSEHGLTNYLVQSTIPTNDSAGNAISQVSTSNYTFNGGTLLNKVTQSTLLNGMSMTTTLDSNGDGIVDETKTDVTTLGADGKTVETITERTGTGGAQIKQQIVTTSADGLHKTVTIAGSGAVLATTQSDTVDNADGSKTTTSITTASGGATRNSTVINTSADSRVTYVTWDLNGDGLTDATESSVIDAGGAKTITDTYYQPDGKTVSSTTVASTSANGLISVVTRSIAAAPSSNTTETTLLSADGSGSYSWTEKDASGKELVFADHTIDQNGIDYVDLWVHGTEVNYRISADQEKQDLAQVQSIYTTLLGRTMSPEEEQTWLKYYTNSGLNTIQLANDLMNSAEFWQDYGIAFSQYYQSQTNRPNTPDPTTLIDAVYQNAFGRLPTQSELNTYSAQFAGPNAPLSLAQFVTGVARVASPAGVADAGFNLQAITHYPLPFGAGGGGGGGVPGSIVTFSSTYGTEIETFDPLTGFLQRIDYYNGTQKLFTDNYDASGAITSEYGYFYNQSGTQLTNAYLQAGNKISYYVQSAADPYNIFDAGNDVLDIVNNADGSSIWNYHAYTSNSLPSGTVSYTGKTSINPLTGVVANSGYLSSSTIYNYSAGTYATEFTTGAPNYNSTYYITEYRIGSGATLASGSTASHGTQSQFTFYDPANQLSFISGMASFVATYSLTSVGYSTNGPDGSGTITASWAHSSNYAYPDSVFNNFLSGGISGSPIGSMLPGWVPSNTQYGFPTAPGAGPATGSSNIPTTTAGGFTLTPPTLTPVAHTIDTQTGHVGGMGGNDTFVYNAGYGSVEIDEDDPSLTPQNSLKLGSTILPSNIKVTADSSGNLYVSDGTAGDMIELAGMLSDKSRGVQSVQFTSNGTSWTRAQLIQAEATGTAAAADKLYGTSGAEVFDGQGGNDYVSGGGGGDTIVYKSGYGLLEVDEQDLSTSPNNLLQMSGINSTNATVISDGTNLYLTDGVAGDLITLDNMASGAEFGVQAVQFSDATWHLADLQARIKAPVVGSAGAADRLSGTAGAEYIDGRGAPTGQSDVVTGGGGNDLFVYNKGYGALEINEAGLSTDQSILKLGPGITLQNVTVQYDAAGNLFLKDGIAGDQVKIDGYFNGSSFGPQVILFADGTVLTKANIVALARPLPVGTYRVGSEFLANTTTAGNQTTPAITGLTNGNFVVSWQSDLAPVTAQLFSSSGSKIGGEFTIATAPANPSISALVGGGFVVAWEGSSIGAQVFDASGAIVGSAIAVDQHYSGQIKPAVTGLANGSFVVTWQDGYYDGNETVDGTVPGSYVIQARMFDRSGNPIGSKFLVDSLTGTRADESPAIAALTGGGFVATWQNDNGGANVQAFDASGNRVGAAITVKGTSTYAAATPTVTGLANGGFVVTWQDGGYPQIDTQTFDAAGNKVGAQSQIPIYSGYTGSSPNPAIALANGGFVVTWNTIASGSGDASGTAIMAQEFDPSGNKVGNAFLVNTQTAGYQINCVIAALSNGGFAIAWQDGNPDVPGDAGSGTLGDTSGSSIKAQVFGTDAVSTVTGTSGNDALLGLGASTLVGNGGNDTYRFDATGKADVVVNGIASNSGPSGTLVLTSSTPNGLWFDHLANNDLEISMLNSAQTITVKNWYGSDQAKLTTIQVGSSALSTNQVDTLVQAMQSFEANYAATHGVAFDPKTAVPTISDSSVLAAVNSTWHQAA